MKQYYSEQESLFEDEGGIDIQRSLFGRGDEADEELAGDDEEWTLQEGDEEELDRDFADKEDEYDEDMDEDDEEEDDEDGIDWENGDIIDLDDIDEDEEDEDDDDDGEDEDEDIDDHEGDEDEEEGILSERAIEANLEAFHDKLEKLDQAEEASKNDEQESLEYFKKKLIAHLDSML